MNFGKERRAAAFAILLLTGLSGCRRSQSASGAPEPGAAPAPLPAARAEAGGYPFTPPEKAAVNEFLRANPNLRVAADSDRLTSSDGDSDLRNLYGVYHAYFVRGDLNDDGLLDFVLAFVRRDSSPETPWFSVVVFTGRERAGGQAQFGPGAFLERDISLARGDLSIDRDAILITPDLADESVRRYRWDPARRSYIFVRDDGGDTESPDVSRT